MTETKKSKLPEPIPVDAKKLIDGIGTIFGGVIQLLGAMEPGMAKELAEMAINGVPAEKVPKPAETEPENIDPNEFEEILSADDLPWDTEPEEKQKKKAPAKKQEPVSELTADDLIKVVTGKIKQNRANKDNILALLKSYGAAKVSDIPQEQYEAFLTDVSQL